MTTKMTVFRGPGPHQKVYRNDKPPFDRHWHDYYPDPPLDDDHVLPKPFPKVRYWSTKWKAENPNPKTAEGFQAMYGMGGMYPGMMGGVNPMMGGMMNPMMGGMMNPMMAGGYGMPRYPMTTGYGGMGMGYGGYPGMYDPMMGYGAPPAANVVDDFADAHRIEHAYRQAAPDNYGIGMATMPGPMGLGNMPGAQMMLYGRGMGYGGGWYY
ncbi:hypothetical protein Q5752_003175 [Cryptotrichosporon argae]